MMLDTKRWLLTLIFIIAGTTTAAAQAASEFHGLSVTGQKFIYYSEVSSFTDGIDRRVMKLLGPEQFPKNLRSLQIACKCRVLRNSDKELVLVSGGNGMNSPILFSRWIRQVLGMPRQVEDLYAPGMSGWDSTYYVGPWRITRPGGESKWTANIKGVNQAYEVVIDEERYGRPIIGVRVVKFGEIGDILEQKFSIGLQLGEYPFFRVPVEISISGACGSVKRTDVRQNFFRLHAEPYLGDLPPGLAKYFTKKLLADIQKQSV